MIDLDSYLVNDAGPVVLVLDLRITHERWGSNSNPSLNCQLHYPSPPDIDRSLNEAPTDKLPFVIIYYSVIKSINVLPPLSGASDREKVYD